VLSALKKAEERETIVVRLFNPDDVKTDVRIATTTSITAAHAVNFLEERQEQLATDGADVCVRMKAHEIRTIELA
jgi:alpha-mannosidase